MNNADAPDDPDQVGSSNGLFSLSATDNAEVVTPGAQAGGGDGLWSVTAKTPLDDESDGDSDGRFAAPYAEAGSDDYTLTDDQIEVEEVEGEIVDGPSGDDDPYDLTGSSSSSSSDVGDHAEESDDESFWDDADEESFDDPDVGFAHSGSRAADSVGSVFSADPVERSDDVVDEPDLIDDDVFPGHDGASSSLFSSGGTVAGGGSSAFSATGAPYFTPAGNPTGADGIWDTTDGVPGRGPAGGPLRTEPLWESSESAYAAQGISDAYLQDPRPAFGEEDSPGYEAAILKLHPQDRERASVALSVAGALLHEGETVLGVVTGQMLGRPAAVVVTAARVLVVNDRRWQPVVDVYKIKPGLSVRGRHDRNIAALSFTDDWSLSMVDGITEVSLAMDLAEQIRVISES